MGSKSDEAVSGGGVARFFVEHRWFGWLAMAAILAWGWVSFQKLPRQEDPTFPTHDALLVTVFPGAPATTIEEAITNPLEEALSRLPSLESIRSQSRDNHSVILITLRSGKKEEIERHWEEAREILRSVELPPGCGSPELDPDFQLPATLLFAVHGEDRGEVEAAAERIAGELGRTERAGRIRQFGNAPDAILSFADFAMAGYSVELLHREEGGMMRDSASVLVAVEMKSGNHIRAFKEEMLARVGEVPLAPGVGIMIVSDQPEATARRIGQFLRCFLEAVVVVVFVASLLMDWRTALVVAVGIPLTLAMTLGGMAALGVPLQQISIAALILALGMLVDDPVVASDGINRELAEGRPRRIAAWLGPFRLRRAIFFGTLINIMAFLPLVLLPGDMGAFILSLPIVMTLALVSSRIVSMTFIPLLGYYLLRGQKGFEAGGEVRRFPPFRQVDLALRALLPRYRATLGFALRHPLATTVTAYGLLVASTLLIPFFGKQFFPPAERNQLLVDIQLPEGSPIERTLEVTHQVGEILRGEASIESAAIVSGGGTPMFYYNILPRQPSPQVAQVLVNTRHADEVPGLIVRLREAFDREVSGALCLVKQIEQGPALETPIEILLTGPDLPEQSALVTKALATAGAYQVHDDAGVITHVDRERTVTVRALPPFGELASRVLDKARPHLPEGAIAFGGEDRELRKSQQEMKRVLLISLALISLAMMIQFRSVAKSVVVMLTVPLGLIGAFVGLAATHASFGFMALIGLVSLAGVIVSHIIVLSDFIEEERAAGVALEEALTRAALVRLRAVLATVFATVCGLIPLALTGGELWRPLTAVHLFGLLFGTLLTLLLLPVLYLLFARWKLIR